MATDIEMMPALRTDREVSPYWRRLGKTIADRRPGRTFAGAGGVLICNECCWKDRPCDTPGHFHRDSCPYCLGTGIPGTEKEVSDANQ